MNKKVIIFDLDGVIVDTELLHYKAYQLTLEKHGVVLDYDLYNEKLRSRGRHIGLAEILGPLSKESIQRIGAEKDGHFLSFISQKPDILYADALELMTYCRAHGIRMGIATASHQGKNLLKTYDLYHWFDHVVSAQDISENKPNPEIYNTCKTFFNLADHEILVIEDSEAGVKAALAANLDVLFVKRDNGPMLEPILLERVNVSMTHDLSSII